VTTAVRAAKIQAVIFVALVVLLAAFTNIQDYDANFAYVQHVLSAKTPGIVGLTGVPDLVRRSRRPQQSALIETLRVE
jgi:predicted small integral membrane protein